MAKKFYVVWKGRQTGIYTDWEECKQQIDRFPGAQYKSYKTLEEAETAYSYNSLEEAESIYGDVAGTSDDYIEESISVDAACSGNPGPMEYRGVYTKDGRELFHYGPVSTGTNNIGEFLAIVHALALSKKNGDNLPIYSDSIIAIGWVKQKKMKSTLERNAETEELWKIIDRAETWLQENDYDNPIYKWDTEKWGEIKADFGRK